MRILGTILVIAAVVPASVLAGAAPTGRMRQLQQIEVQERQIRALSQIHPVRAQFPDNRAFNALVSGQMRQDNPPGEIAISQRELDEVGFLRAGQSLRRILLSDMASQVAGVYDYTKKVLYVRGQDNQAFNLERYVIVHEYTHALQDQHWNLRKILPDEYKLRYRNSDSVTARHALVEGDAVNTQNLYINRSYTPAEFRAMIAYERSQPSGPPLPWAIRTQFYFPYTTGAAFVEALYKAGGMPAINAAFSRLPSSTYEIIFPNAYVSHWKPEQVVLHGVAGFKSWRQVDDDVFGALGYEMLLWQHSSEIGARNAIRSYKGDRYVFLEKGSANLLLMKSRWSSHSAAEAVGRVLTAGLAARFGRNSAWNGKQAILSVPGLAVLVGVSGNALSVAYAPAPATAVRLGTSTTT